MQSLRADGVALRAWEPADAAAIATICGDPEVCAWDYLPWEHDLTVLAAWVERQRIVNDTGERTSLTIADPSSGAALGWVGLSPRAGGVTSGTWTVGYWVIPEARRRGLALGAARALTGHALAHGRVRRILLETGPHNIGSQAIALRLGGRLVGHRRALDRTGAEHDQLVYEIVA
ncbi:MAG: GNAT family N-acetyltransferase [Solirubrobacteraceae bacterium]